MTAVAAVDIGTNSVRLLVVDAQGRELLRLMQITRLGQGVDETGALADEAMDRTVFVLRDFAAQFRSLGCERVRITATSAARDATNRDGFFERVRTALGCEPELISGEEEARLSFLGATADLQDVPGPFVVFDIGGGSTEFALGQEGPEQFISVDMGSVRLTERFLSADPPTREQLDSAAEMVREHLARVERVVDVQRARLWIGLAGTVTTFAARVFGLETYDPGVTHGSELTRAQVRRIFQELSVAKVGQRRTMIAEPKRAEVIVGGAVVLDTIMDYFSLARIRVSERDILDGLAASIGPQAGESAV
jgi:exopolyphosphatase / guanosine-5'-triphosphate,3'-diphosphate pyrophosphatase